MTLIRNAHEPKRTHLAVYNWEWAKERTANVSAALNDGDKFSLYSAQDFLAGPIKTGTVSGKTISIPMTNLTIAPVLYWPTLTQPKTTSPEFAAFVLI